jgi:hypothetical protein
MRIASSDQCLEHRPRELNVLALFKGSIRHIFVYDDLSLPELHADLAEKTNSTTGFINRWDAEVLFKRSLRSVRRPLSENEVLDVRRTFNAIGWKEMRRVESDPSYLQTLEQQLEASELAQVLLPTPGDQVVLFSPWPTPWPNRLWRGLLKYESVLFVRGKGLYSTWSNHPTFPGEKRVQILAPLDGNAGEPSLIFTSAAKLRLSYQPWLSCPVMSFNFARVYAGLVRQLGRDQTIYSVLREAFLAR